MHDIFEIAIEFILSRCEIAARLFFYLQFGSRTQRFLSFLNDHSFQKILCVRGSCAKVQFCRRSALHQHPKSKPEVRSESADAAKHVLPMCNSLDGSCAAEASHGEVLWLHKDSLGRNVNSVRASLLHFG